jgi:hypothetical protein
MKKVLLFICVAAFLFSCNNGADKTATATTGTGDSATAAKVDLPYTASFSSSFTQDVSDADLKMVLMTYKDWENNNITGLSNAVADTVLWDMSNGDHKTLTRAELTKLWSTYRDSLSSVKIDMGAWHKMYATDKKAAFVVTWYDETDTYKSGKVDSASYQDINMVKDGKLAYYSQYKRPKK